MPDSGRQQDVRASLITTAKDAVKLRTLSFSIPCYVLEIEIAIENAERVHANDR